MYLNNDSEDFFLLCPLSFHKACQILVKYVILGVNQFYENNKNFLGFPSNIKWLSFFFFCKVCMILNLVFRIVISFFKRGKEFSIMKISHKNIPFGSRLKLNIFYLKQKVDIMLMITSTNSWFNSD